MRDMVVVEERAHRAARIKGSLAGFVSRDYIGAVIMVLLALLSWAPRTEGPLDTRWDGATYYVLGTALAEGKGYRLLNEPGEIEGIQYPPLLPALVAAHQLVLGTNDPVIVGRALRVTFFGIYLAYALGSYALLRQLLPFPYALGASLLVVLNLFTNFLSDALFAEIPYAMVGVLFVLCLRTPGRLAAGLAAVLAVAAYLLRTVGVALFAAWIGESLLRGRYRTAAMRAMIAVVPVLAWHGYIHAVESSPAYEEPAYAYQRAEYLFYNVSYSRNVSLRDPFQPELGKLSIGELAQRFGQHLVSMPVSIGEGLSAKLGYWRMYSDSLLQHFRTVRGIWRVADYGPELVLALLGGLILLGVGLLFRDKELFIGLYILFVLAALCLTPWPAQWPRYWAPMAPFLALGFARSMLALERGVRRVRPLAPIRLAALMLAGLILVVQVLTLRSAYAEQMGRAVYTDRNGATVSARLFFYEEDGYRELDAAFDWLNRHARPGDVIAASMPHWAYLRTGLKSVMPPFERDLVRMQALLDSVPVTYVIVDASPINFARDYTLPLLKTSPAWTLVYQGQAAAGRQRDVLEIYQRVRSAWSSAPHQE